MSADPWELLKEARDKFVEYAATGWTHSQQKTDQARELLTRIDIALAAREKQAEPVAQVIHGSMPHTPPCIIPLDIEFYRSAIHGTKLYAAPPDSIPRDLHDRLIREARRDGFLEAARIVEHEAFPSELPRFRVATDVLRDRADELDKEQK